MTVAIRIAWVLYGLYQLLMALGAFPYSPLAALVLGGAAVGTMALFLARSVVGGYVAAGLTALAPFVVNATAGDRMFGTVWLAANVLVAILMAWLAHLLGREQAARSW